MIYIQKNNYVWEHDGYYYRELCRHCLHPACASSCPVGAIYKTPEGPVLYDEKKCIGCRYCILACPYNVPRYQWEKTKPLVGKCDFCPSWMQTGRRYLRRSVESMLEEIAAIDEPYIYFVCEESLLNTKSSLALAAALKESGIKKRFGMPLRADTIVKKPHVIEAWAEQLWHWAGWQRQHRPVEQIHGLCYTLRAQRIRNDSRSPFPSGAG